MDVVVFGAGSLGSLLGGLLARSHRVTLVGRDPHVRAIREGGLEVGGVESISVRPEASTDGEDRHADVALVTVKAYDTAGAAAALTTGEFRAVASLQNGMGNEATLAAAVSAPVVAGTTSYAAAATAPGRVEWRGGGSTQLGAWDDAPVEAAELVAEAFDAAGMDAQIVPDAHSLLWRKLAVNAAINPLTALADVPNGALAEPPLRGLGRRVAREAAAVARAEGVELPGATAVETLETVVQSTADNRSSMRADLADGSRTEIDAITGHVVDRADERGIDVPHNRTLCGLVRARERATRDGEL